MKKIKLSKIIDAFNMINEEFFTYLNISTEEIVHLETRFINIIKEEVDLSNYFEWEKKAVYQAIDIEENFSNYIKFPEYYQINDYEIVEKFSMSLPDDLQSPFLNAIKDKGAFKRFRQMLELYNLLEYWYEYRNNYYVNLAKDWCTQNNIEYYE